MFNMYAMKKIQILFPEPMLNRLRTISTNQDRPVSELVRRATERWLETVPEAKPSKELDVPVFDGGEILVSAERMKEFIYDEES